MNTDGGFGELIRVPSQWVLTPNPFHTRTATASHDTDAAASASASSTARVSMVYGTAGLTAALCVQRLLDDGRATPGDGAIAVTGASGGVGSVSVEILAQLGFDVVAVSGKASSSAHDGLTQLGAHKVVVSALRALRADKQVLWGVRRVSSDVVVCLVLRFSHSVYSVYSIVHTTPHPAPSIEPIHGRAGKFSLPTNGRS